MRKKIIKPAMNHPYNFLLKRISDAEKIDFSDFLVESGYLTKRAMENLIIRFDGNIPAKERICQFLL